MDLNLSEQQRANLHEFKKFCHDNIQPYAIDIEKTGEIPVEMIVKMSQKGYLGSNVSIALGGLSLDNISIGLLNEEVGKALNALRNLLTVHGMVCLAIEKWGTQAQKEYWLPLLSNGSKIAAFALSEPTAGSDTKAILSKAESVGNSYKINGVKKWITFGQIADLFLVMAKCDDKPTAFLVEKETPGLTIKPIENIMGSRTSKLAELTFKNCIISNNSLLGKIGTGLTHIAQTSLDYGRFTIAWGCLGISQGCLEQSIDYALERTQFDTPLWKNQLIQKMITEMTVNIKAARLLCYNAGFLKDSKDHESIMETWNAKYFASKTACLAADHAVQIHGANGCYSNFPIERYYREAKVMEIIEGTSQMHELLIATHTVRNKNY